MKNKFETQVLWGAMISVLLGAKALAVPTTPWHACDGYTNCKERTIGDTYELMGQTIQVEPGAIERVYTNQAPSIYPNNVRLKLTADFTLRTAYSGALATMQKGTSLEVGDLSFKGHLKNNIVLPMAGGSLEYTSTLWGNDSDAYDAWFFMDGKLMNGTLANDSDYTLAGQKVKIGMDTGFYPSGQLQSTWLKTDVDFPIPNDPNHVYWFPAETQYQGGRLRLTEDGKPDLSRDSGGAPFIKEATLKGLQGSYRFDQGAQPETRCATGIAVEVNGETVTLKINGEADAITFKNETTQTSRNTQIQGVVKRRVLKRMEIKRGRVVDQTWVNAEYDATSGEVSRVWVQKDSSDCAYRKN